MIQAEISFWDKYYFIARDLENRLVVNIPKKAMELLNFEWQPDSHIGCRDCDSENLEVLLDFQDDPDWTWNEDLTKLGESNFVFCWDCYSIGNMTGSSRFSYDW